MQIAHIRKGAQKAIKNSDRNSSKRMKVSRRIKEKKAKAWKRWINF